MNERIKELAEQAGYLPDMFGIGHWDMPECIKFAELVAEQTHTNNKAKWYQEGYEAGQRDERDACAKLCERAHTASFSALHCADLIIGRTE
jgi:hypothetical protein